VAEQAENIRYASIDLKVNGTGGLLVLSEQAPGITYWLTGQKQVVVFKSGYLASTSGLKKDLITSEYDPPLAEFAAPAADNQAVMREASNRAHQLVRTWQTNNGGRRSSSGRATIKCESDTHLVALPLATLPLEKCRESVQWRTGERTTSVYWRDPKTHRIWAAEVVAWPGGPTVAWDVARPWW